MKSIWTGSSSHRTGEGPSDPFMKSVYQGSPCDVSSNAWLLSLKPMIGVDWVLAGAAALRDLLAGFAFLILFDIK